MAERIFEWLLDVVVGIIHYRAKVWVDFFVGLWYKVYRKFEIQSYGFQTFRWGLIITYGALVLLVKIAVGCSFQAEGGQAAG